MRPPEQDVTFALYRLDCRVTEDAGGDEPYMWILGFKVDADTISPQVGSLLPALGVKIFEGAPASPFLVGAGSVDSPAVLSIPTALGTRAFRLRPDLLVTGDWFGGLAGVIALLWDQDAFAPSTSEAAFNAFKKAFGPALSVELNNLVNGNYDVDLSKDADGKVVAPPDANAPLQWRLDRLGNAAARANAVKAITHNVKDKLVDVITVAVKAVAGLDELIDKDDLLGVAAQAYLGQELSSTAQDFSLDFTDDEADYTARGHVFGTRVRLARLDSAVTGVARTFDRMTEMWLRVCWFPAKLYSAFAFKVATTTRFDLRNLGSEPPVAVRWFLDDKPLVGAQGTVMVKFEGADAYFGPPQDGLGAAFPGGNASLTFKASGAALEISNAGGEGVFFGTVTALYAFPGDPPLFPSPDLPLSQLQDLCYWQASDLSVVAVDLTMDSAYKGDVASCKRIIHEIDRKHIAVNMGRAVVDPGDPPRDRQALLDIVTADARVANAVNLRQAAAPRAANLSKEIR